MHRFFVDRPLEDEIVITGSDARHISIVLRLKTGDRVYLTDCCKKTGLFTIKDSALKGVLVELVEVILEQREASICVTVAQGLAKSDKMDYIIQKAVELGVSKIVPLTVTNCVVKIDEYKQKNRVERWQKIAYEAAKQCRRSLLPAVTEVQSLPELLKGIAENTKIIMLYEGDNIIGIKTALKSAQVVDNYLIIVGPEGGFCREEVELCCKNGAQIVSLGPRILRTETASLAALAVVMYEYGCLGG